MPDLTGTENNPTAGEPEPDWAWIRWHHSARDGQVHAFWIEARPPGSWLQAVCTHTAPPAALGSCITLPYCPDCLQAITTPGTGYDPRRVPLPGVPTHRRPGLPSSRTSRCRHPRAASVMTGPRAWRDQPTPPRPGPANPRGGTVRNAAGLAYRVLC